MGHWLILNRPLRLSSLATVRSANLINPILRLDNIDIHYKVWGQIIYLVLCPELTLIQPMWSAYPYHLVFLIWYPYSLVFLIWYPYALNSLYGNTAHCSGYGVAMGCYGLFIVTKTAIVTSQWYDRYCFMEYARTWASHPTTPWQRECTTITDRQSIDSLLDSMRFVMHFWEMTLYILRDFGPRTPYRVGGLAGDVMHAWVNHSLVNHWIYNLKPSLLSC